MGSLDDAPRISNWERLGMVGRTLVVIAAAVLVGPAAAFVRRGGQGEGMSDGVMAFWVGVLAGPLLMPFAGEVFAGRRESWGFWLSLAGAVLHVGVVVAGVLLAMLFSGMIAPCNAKEHFVPGVVTAVVVGSTVPLGVMICLATRWWVFAPAMLAAALLAGWCCESAGATGPSWGVLVWSAGVLLPLGAWLGLPARLADERSGSSAGRCPWCGYNLRGVPVGRVCPECGRGAR